MKYRNIIYLVIALILAVMICINQERIEKLELKQKELTQIISDYTDRYERMIKYNQWLIGG